MLVTFDEITEEITLDNKIILDRMEAKKLAEILSKLYL